MSDQEEAEPTPTATPHVPIVCVRYRYRLLGGHAHVRVFAGKDFDHLAKCGDLVFRLEEWAALVAVMDCDRNGVYDIVEEPAVRTVRIRQDDGAFRAAPYDELRKGMVFELLEPDGSPAHGGGLLRALSDVADDAGVTDSAMSWGKVHMLSSHICPDDAHGVTDLIGGPLSTYTADEIRAFPVGTEIDDPKAPTEEARNLRYCVLTPDGWTHGEWYMGPALTMDEFIRWEVPRQPTALVHFPAKVTQ